MAEGCKHGERVRTACGFGGSHTEQWTMGQLGLREEHGIDMWSLGKN